MQGTIHKIHWNAEVLRATRSACLIAGIIAASGVASAQANIPDAQVEANVLKALASAPELATESITTNTVYGTVTLTGTVSGESARTKAENLAANANGVKKVVDELTLSSQAVADNSQQPAQPSQQPASMDSQPPQLMLQSDGTYAPAPTATAPNQAPGQPQVPAMPADSPAPGTAPAATAVRNNPQADAALDQQMDQQAQAQAGVTQPNAQQPAPAQAAPNQPAQPTYPAPRRPVYPNYPGYPPYGYPQQAPPAGAYAQQPYQQGQPPMGGQAAGQPVTIPSGALLRVRINRPLISNKTAPGTVFDGIVMNDVTAGGLVAIPRGAVVQGKVIDAKSSGAISGRGEMSVQLTQVTLAGKVYPLSSDVWAHNGADKTIETVNKTAGLGVMGAIVGAVVGGGKGAAIGGGVGAATGMASSAASPNGQVYVPAEAILTFHTTADTPVATVSEQEMQRLAWAAGPSGAPQPVARPYRVYPGYYPPPGYYPYPSPGYPTY